MEENKIHFEEVRIQFQDIYKSLWSCRDFEISHLWQRSIFLTTFLLAGFTGYGFILSRLLGDTPIQNYVILNILAGGIALAGIILSMLWIMMAKGSKAWYEKYEDAIWRIEHDADYTSDLVKGLILKGLIHGSLSSLNSDRISNNIFDTRGGAYSVSRINIVLGQMAFVIWVVVLLVHYILCFTADETQEFLRNHCLIVIPMLLGIIIIGGLIWFCKSSLVRSTGLDNE